MKPTVSIVIPFYNCSYIAQAVQSALNQTYPNIELIVVDDGSTKEIERLTPFMSRITYIKKKNGGTATAINEGIKKAKGTYIAWLSSDDYIEPLKVEKQVEFMLKHNAKASFHNYDYVGPQNEPLLSYVGKRFTNANEVYRSFMTINPVNGCSVMLHRDIFQEVGYFNQDLRFTQDYDMWFRILLKGHVMYYLDEVLLNYRSHPNSGTSQHGDKMKHEILVVRNYYQPKIANYLRKHSQALKMMTF
ncbi:glycosyltransferase family 2 protein [Bacillus sp. KH172YL63]|uniref:glycosyltransferase family 2 protein n=1 Tax=Bacillus sp. KH172YL63 TaxID=2709784 RepID=UPI0013E49EBE|nr:glycosyltransferase [Bacillus sp. KH172YL63]BCB03643.1 glycosyl transferase family 2 [Bacillus sp. KH172YL63]